MVNITRIHIRPLVPAGVSIDPKISHKFTAWSGSLSSAHISERHGLGVFRGYIFVRFGGFGISLLQRYLCRLTQTTVIILQGALAGGANHLRPEATVLSEVSLHCRRLLLCLGLCVLQVGRPLEILTVLVNFLFRPSAKHHNQDQPQAVRGSKCICTDLGVFPATPLDGSSVHVRRTRVPRETSLSGKPPFLASSWRRRELTRTSDPLFWDTVFSMDITSTEALSNIVAIVYSPTKVDVARKLRGDKAQSFVDLIDRVSDSGDSHRLFWC